MRKLVALTALAFVAILASACGTAEESASMPTLAGTQTPNDTLAPSEVPTVSPSPTASPTPTPEPTTTPTPTPKPVIAPGQIVFSSFRDQDRDVYVIHGDGTRLTNLTDSPGKDDRPVWSPDGSKIAFRSDRGGSAAICMMNADGSGLASVDGVWSNFAWSPDGSRAAFIADFGHGLYVVNADGTGRTLLTTFGPQGSGVVWSPDGRKIAVSWGRDFNLIDARTGVVNVASVESKPAWSPDGSVIAFSSSRDQNREIYLMNPDGTGVARLTNSPADDTDPVWSPDGSKIVFFSRVGDGDTTINVMNVGGTGVTMLASDSGNIRTLIWSPDSTRIAYTSRGSGIIDLYIVNADGTGLARLPDVESDPPTWSPDGTALAFMSLGEIYLVNADGTGRYRLPTGNLGLPSDSDPAWSPVP